MPGFYLEQRSLRDKVFLAKENAFFPVFGEPLLADLQAVSGEGFLDTLRRITIGKEQADYFPASKGEGFAFNGNLASILEIEVGDNAFQTAFGFGFETQFTVVFSDSQII